MNTKQLCQTAALLISTQSIFRLTVGKVGVFTRIEVLKDGLIVEGFYPHLQLEFCFFFAFRMWVCIWTSLKKD